MSGLWVPVVDIIDLNSMLLEKNAASLDILDDKLKLPATSLPAGRGRQAETRGERRAGQKGPFMDGH